jgi:hypothetical protein
MHYLTAHYILVIAAFIVALLAAFQWLTAPRVNLVALALALFFLSLLVGCSTMTTWRSQLAPDTLGNKAVIAAAEHYGGKDAADLASAGLSATADVLQGYVDKKPPIDVITQSPGVQGVGHIILDYLKDKKIITQSTVDNIHKAALFAAQVTWTKDAK